jgi:hypothetical protein
MSDFGDEVIPVNVATIVFPSQGTQCLNDKGKDLSHRTARLRMTIPRFVETVTEHEARKGLFLYLLTIPCSLKHLCLH